MQRPRSPEEAEQSRPAEGRHAGKVRTGGRRSRGGRGSICLHWRLTDSIPALDRRQSWHCEHGLGEVTRRRALESRSGAHQDQNGGRAVPGTPPRASLESRVGPAPRGRWDRRARGRRPHPPAHGPGSPGVGAIRPPFPTHFRHHPEPPSDGDGLDDLVAGAGPARQGVRRPDAGRVRQILHGLRRLSAAGRSAQGSLVSSLHA